MAWSWILTGFGLSVVWLAGRKVWWSWYVGIVGQAAWLAYALATGQLGFIVGTVAYSTIYAKNALAWTREHGRATTDPDLIVIDRRRGWLSRLTDEFC